ncbi:hypothetical protein D3C75_853530 [compost metagenome]
MLQRLSAIREVHFNLHFFQILGRICVVINVGCDRTRTDGIDSDFVLCQLQRRHLHKSDLASLSRTVCGESDIREYAVAVDRAVDQNAAALLLHMRDSIFDCRERSAEINMNRLVPGFDIHRLNRCHRPVNSGICKDDIQPPPLRGSLLHRFFHLLRVLDITGNHNRFPAFLFDLPFYFFGMFRSTV